MWVGKTVRFTPEFLNGSVTEGNEYHHLMTVTAERIIPLPQSVKDEGFSESPEVLTDVTGLFWISTKVLYVTDS